jgi:DNA-binding CsgD family transcriptional regulator
VTCHGAQGLPFDRARTQLAYGEHLRRSRQRVAARTQLRASLQTFEGLQAAPWEERAAAAPVDPTPQERQVARLVAQGRSNRDAAAQLFISPRTVDFHLRNVYSKLGVASRAELANVPWTDTRPPLTAKAQRIPAVLPVRAGHSPSYRQHPRPTTAGSHARTDLCRRHRSAPGPQEDP